MRSTLHSIAFGLAGLLGASAMAQQPYYWLVSGQVNNCYPGQTVNVQTIQGTTPVINMDVPVDTATCTFNTALNISSAWGMIQVTAACGGQTSTVFDTTSFNFLLDTAYSQINFSCGAVYDCLGLLNGPNVPGTPCNDNNPNTTGDTWHSDCTCIGDSSFFQYDCLGVLNGPNIPGTVCDDGDSSTVQDHWTVNCECTGTNSIWYDCLQIPYGPNVPGTACSDNNPDTFNDTWSINCVCVGTDSSFVPCNASFTFAQSSGGGMTFPWVMETTNLSSGVGLTYTWWMPDGSSSNQFEPYYQFNAPGVYGICLTVMNSGCSSVMCDTVYVDANGTITSEPSNTDCLGIPNGTNLPGTPCDDGNSSTINDTWSSFCACAGTTVAPCDANFWVIQAYEGDSVNPTPIPYELWVWNLSSGGSGQYTYTWNFGDGSTSSDPFPTHVYADNGPFTLCLTINDGMGCEDSYCDEVSIDDDGIYSGIAGEVNRSSGFTIAIRNQTETGVNEIVSNEGVALWPNPVNEELNVAVSGVEGNAVNVTVVDMSGKTVLSQRHAFTGRDRFTFATNDLEPGMYMVRVDGSNRTISQRFVKTR